MTDKQDIWTMIAALFKSGWVDVKFLERSNALQERGADWSDPEMRKLFREPEEGEPRTDRGGASGQVDGESPHGPHYEANARWVKSQIQ